MRDNDGKEKWSTIVRLDEKAGAIFYVYPNPASKTIYITHGKVEGSGIIEIFSVMGERLKTAAVAKGELQTELNVAELAPGTYLVKYSDSNKSASRLIIKQ